MFHPGEQAHQHLMDTLRRSHGWQLALERTRTAETGPGVRRTTSCGFFCFVFPPRPVTVGGVVLLGGSCTFRGIVNNIYLYHSVL